MVRRLFSYGNDRVSPDALHDFDFNEVFTDNLDTLNGKIKQCWSGWDDIINIRHQIKTSWETVLNSLLFLQVSMNNQRMEMTKKKMEAQELAIIPPDQGPSGVEFFDAIKQLNDAINKHCLYHKNT